MSRHRNTAHGTRVSESGTREGARRGAARALVPAYRLDRYVTSELHKLPGFESVSVSVGYRLRATEEDGCNWSGDMIPRYGRGAPCAAVVTAALRPIARAARARFNLSE
jgi:hypothetical protein